MFCLNKSILGSDYHYCNGWTEEVPEDVWIVGGDVPKEKDLLSAFYLGGSPLEILPPAPFIKMMRSLTFSNVPWQKVLPDFAYSAFLEGAIDNVTKSLKEIDTSYYQEVFIPAYKTLQRLKPAKINEKKWEFLASHNIAGLNDDVINSFEPNEDGFADPIVYEQIDTVSGRHKVKEGPQILRLNRDFKSIIESRYKGGKIVQFDYVALEPRIALMLAGKPLKNDIYSDLNADLFKGKFTRDIAKLATLSVLYGSGANKLSEETGLDISRCKEIQPILKEYFGVFKQRSRLSKQYKKKKSISNFFGRFMYPNDGSSHKLFNHYIQSSAVDAAMLGFWNVVQMLPERVIPLFIIHDNMMLDFPPDLIDDGLFEKIKEAGGNIDKLPNKLLLDYDML